MAMRTWAIPICCRNGAAGLLDWQLCVRGYCMHDVSYLIATGLPIALRREHERRLLNRYRERLIELGVRRRRARDEIWNEYRRAMVWGVYIGWLTTPVVKLRLGNQRRQSLALDHRLRGSGHGPARCGSDGVMGATSRPTRAVRYAPICAINTSAERRMCRASNRQARSASRAITASITSRNSPMRSRSPGVGGGERP